MVLLRKNRAIFFFVRPLLDVFQGGPVRPLRLLRTKAITVYTPHLRQSEEVNTSQVLILLRHKKLYCNEVLNE